MPSVEVDPEAGGLLRCDGCGRQGHFGPRWSRTEQAGRTPIRVHRRTALSEQDRADEALARAEVLNERWAEAQKRFELSLPPRMLRTEDGDVLDPVIKDRLERLGSKEGRHATGLLVLGTVGAGKTWVAYSYLREVVSRRLLWPSQIKFGTETELLDPILQGGYEAPARRAALLDDNCRMLLIDDVGQGGKVRDPGDRHALYTAILNWAYDHDRSIVITTNLTPGPKSPLGDHLGPAAYDRMINIVDNRGVINRQEMKRAEFTKMWEAEYAAARARK